MVKAFLGVLPRRSGEGEKYGITGCFSIDCVFGMRLRFWSDIGNESVRIQGWDYPCHPCLAKESATPSLSSQLNRSGRAGTISWDRSRWLRLLPSLGRTRSDCFTRSKRSRRGRLGRERAPKGRGVGPSPSRSGDPPTPPEGHRLPETLKCASPLRRPGSGPSSGRRICRHPRGIRRRRRPRFCNRNR